MRPAERPWMLPHSRSAAQWYQEDRALYEGLVDWCGERIGWRWLCPTSLPKETRFEYNFDYDDFDVRDPVVRCRAAAAAARRLLTHTPRCTLPLSFSLARAGGSASGRSVPAPGGRGPHCAGRLGQGRGVAHGRRSRGRPGREEEELMGGAARACAHT